MPFFRRHEKKDIDEIKEAVNEPDEYESYHEEYQPAVTKAEQPEREIFAPLFVKVDKYKESLVNLQEVKVLVDGIKNIFSILSEIEDVRKDALNTLRVTLQRIEKNIIELDTELLRPGNVKLDVGTEPDTRHIEDSLSQLHKQLDSLKGEMEKIKGWL